MRMTKKTIAGVVGIFLIVVVQIMIFLSILNHNLGRVFGSIFGILGLCVVGIAGIVLLVIGFYHNKNFGLDDETDEWQEKIEQIFLDELSKKMEQENRKDDEKRQILLNMKPARFSNKKKNELEKMFNSSFDNVIGVEDVGINGEKSKFYFLELVEEKYKDGDFIYIAEIGEDTPQYFTAQWFNGEPQLIEWIFDNRNRLIKTNNLGYLEITRFMRGDAIMIKTIEQYKTMIQK